MASIETIAKNFFDACETGKGWQVCKAYCTPDATFASQAEPIADMKKLADYTDWMTGLLKIIPDGSYKVKAFAVDAQRNSVSGFGVFSGTHTGPGGPVPPTGKRVDADYVYVMEFAGDKIRHMTKIWNAGWTIKALGWA